MEQVRFTQAEIFALQRGNLLEWQQVLKPAVFKKLKEVVAKENKKIKPEDDGDKIIRGQRVSDIVFGFMDEYRNSVYEREQKADKKLLTAISKSVKLHIKNGKGVTSTTCKKLVEMMYPAVPFAKYEGIIAEQIAARDKKTLDRLKLEKK